MVSRGCSLNGYAVQVLASAAADRLVRRHELEDPAFFVEWARRRSAERDNL
jgi:hypothetical protein